MRAAAALLILTFQCFTLALSPDVAATIAATAPSVETMVTSVLTGRFQGQAFDRLAGAAPVKLQSLLRLCRPGSHRRT